MAENRKARPWIRLYTDLTSNPKVQRLTPPVFKFWVNCLCLYGKNGVLPEFRDISWALKMREDQVSDHILKLTELGLFDELEDGVTPHDWDELQFESDTSKERQKAYRERKLNRHGDGGVTSRVTPQEQRRADTEQSKRRADDCDVTSLVESLYARHPANGCGRSEIRDQLSGILKKIPPSKKAETLRLIDDNHAAWCETERWRNGYVRGLANWLAPTKNRWRDPPPAETKQKTLGERIAEL